MLECVEDKVLQHRAPDAPSVRTGSHFAGRGAGQIVTTHRSECATAAAAPDNTGQQVAGPAFLPKAGGADLTGARGTLDFIQTLGYTIPECSRNYLEVGNLVDHPLRFGVYAGDPLSALGVLDKPLAVPDEPADIGLIAKNAVSPPTVA